MIAPDARMHPTAIVEDGVEHRRAVRRSGTTSTSAAPTPASADDCIIGEKTYIAYGVRIGDRVKINAFVYICTAVSRSRTA